jgi:selenocysteine lyase/cysteine desulfurase
LVRVGITHYNIVEEVECLLTVVNALAHQTIQ